MTLVPNWCHTHLKNTVTGRSILTTAHGFCPDFSGRLSDWAVLLSSEGNERDNRSGDDSNHADAEQVVARGGTYSTRARPDAVN